MYRRDVIGIHSHHLTGHHDDGFSGHRQAEPWHWGQGGTVGVDTGGEGGADVLSVVSEELGTVVDVTKGMEGTAVRGTRGGHLLVIIHHSVNLVWLKQSPTNGRKGQAGC